MKHTLKQLLSALMAIALALSLGTAVSWHQTAVLQAEDLPADSRDNASEAVKSAISHMIYAFGQNDPQGVSQSLADLKAISENDWFPVYENIMSFWSWCENDMVEHASICPDGLEDPAHHCFITLGYALNDDGTMTDELIGRLTVAKNCLDKYPQSRIVVTGGVEKNGWTEGVRMRDWLVANGIDESRIYVENKAPDTAGNATYSFDILYKAGDIKTVSLISSQYHLRRGSILYYTEALLKARELNKTPIEFLGDMNAGWPRADKTAEPLSTKANSMYSICRVPKLEAPKFDPETELTGLDVIFPEGNTTIQGTTPKWSVKTKDTKNQNLTVTEFCTFTGYDPAKIGRQTVTASFTYEGKTVTDAFEVEVIYPAFKNALADAAQKAAALDGNGYSKASFETLTAALQQANAVLANPNASQPEAEEALAALNHAAAGLHKKTAPAAPAPKAERISMLRLYNPHTGEHFFTASRHEYEVLLSKGWKAEGNGWIAPSVSDRPVYRLYNPNQGDHHYTCDDLERQSLKTLGWQDEGIGWYSADESGLPLYRHYNPNAKYGTHHYTMDQNESDTLVGAGWVSEGISWYGLRP